MKRFVLPRIGSLFLVASLAPLAFAQTQTSSQGLVRDPQAIGLATRSLTAMGASTVSSQTDSRATGALTMYFQAPVTMNVVWESKGLTETRSELQRANGTSVRVLQGGQAAIRNPDGSIRQLNQVNTLYEHVNHIPIFSLLAEVQNPSVEVTVVSQASSNGTADDVISLSLASSSDATQAQIQRQLSRTLFYINQATGLLDKMEYTYYSEGSASTAMDVQQVFSDYRSVSGAAVPFHQTTFVDGRLESDLQLNALSFNVGISDADFVVPVGQP